MALGADGVLMGTRFMATDECLADPKLKDVMVMATEMDTMLIQRSIKNPVRVWCNEPARKVKEMEKAGASLEDILAVTTGNRGKRVVLEGKLNEGTVTFGQVVGMVKHIPTVREVIDDMVENTTQIRDRLLKQIASPLFS
jgi:nitronate monooxygenase